MHFPLEAVTSKVIVNFKKSFELLRNPFRPFQAKEISSALEVRLSWLGFKSSWEETKDEHFDWEVV